MGHVYWNEFLEFFAEGLDAGFADFCYFCEEGFCVFVHCFTVEDSFLQSGQMISLVFSIRRKIISSSPVFTLVVYLFPCLQLWLSSISIFFHLLVFGLGFEDFFFDAGFVVVFEVGDAAFEACPSHLFFEFHFV